MRFELVLSWPPATPIPLELVLAGLLLALRHAPPHPLRSSQDLSIFRLLRR